MDAATLIENDLKENEVLKKLKCESKDCDTFPKLGSNIYICSQCQKYKCEFHADLHGFRCRTFGHTMILDSMITEVFSCVGKSISKLVKPPEPEKSFHCSYSENGCKKEFLAQKAHERSCNYQNVCCPSMNCKESVIFEDIIVHLDQAHKIEKVNDEWNFEGTDDELVKVVCCLTSTSYFEQFFPQMYIKDNHLYFKVIMLGHHQENVINFRACFTFFQDNGQQFSREDFVYPITEKDEKYPFSCESLKKLTQYYDLKSMELKQQEKIHFTLKITNAKLDMIAKDKNSRENESNDSQ